MIASLVSLAMGLAPAAGYAAGLGRLTVLSSIGQPLVGEIELLSVRKDELTSLAARIAPPDAYSNANVTLNPALVGARVSVERRPNGQPYLRVTSNRPVDEPYVDLLVELTWNTGRLLREYTALIDPPGFGPAQTATPVAVPETRPAPAAPVAAPLAPARAASPVPAAPADAGARTYGPVQPGDTLRKIAAGVKPEGVSLDQALVAIYRSNPDAFINNNMNLLRTGRILRIPDAAEAGRVSAGEAANEVRVQAADWNAYRSRAAAAVPEVPAGEARAAAGKITTRVEEPAPTTPAKEVVKVSKGAPGKDAPADRALQDRIRVLEEEATAREKTIKDANDRIASLEKTIKDMQRLIEMKGAVLPPAAKPAAEAPEAKPEAAKPPEAPKPAVEPAKPETAPLAPPVAETKPEVAPPPAEKPPVAEAKPEPKKDVPPPAAPPAVEQAWWEDPTLLGGALAALGILGAGAYLMSRRRRQEQAAVAEIEPVFRAPSAAAPAAAAAAVAAAVPVPSVTTEMPAAAPQAAADDVDPIAEADVYIAYGRDAQAEEILKEALARDSSRQEIKLKLLEIYAARKSKNDFNALAGELHDSTQGRGDVWLKAATMGYALDPDNALYAAGKDSAILPPVGVATDVNLDFDLDMVTAAGAPTTVTDFPLDAGEDNVKTTVLSPERMEMLRAEGAAMAAKRATDSQSIVPDFDLGSDLSAPQTDVTLEPALARGPITDVNLDLPAAATATDSNVIDFEFDPGKTIKVEPEAAAAFAHDQTVIISPEHQQQAKDLGVEIDLGALDAAPPTIPMGSEQIPMAEQTADISFDFQLPDEPAATTDIVPPTDIKLDVPDLKPAAAMTMDFALDTVSLDLGAADKKEAPAPVHDDHWYDVQTKFDLAKAYQEMGDKDGAREILAEVIKEGDAQQQAEANELLAKLG
ncbi:MAG: FimV family protein [Burkholderiales bacterium]|nr:FimV family protein [Burkholderiales bacterium]